MERIPVVVLGATGMVGQRMVERLAVHPWFQVGALAASARSEGRAYRESCVWRLASEPYGGVGDLPVLACSPSEVPSGVRLALSGLDARAARDIEANFRSAGFGVVSNASAWRQDPLVPLVIPEVNPHHLALVKRQAGPGYIVTNPNCSSIPLTLVLAPLHRAFGVQAVVTATWQAVSGAGYPGESAWDMVGNVHPHAGDEEEKMSSEPLKMLGEPDAPASFPISARCVRVPVADGHLVSAQIRLNGSPCVADVIEVLKAFGASGPEIPSSPRPLFRFTDRRDRPSPRFDADAGAGMAVTIGRVEFCSVMGIKLFCLAHNTIRGAAGAAIADLELLRAKGLLPE